MIQKPEIQYVGQFYIHGSEARQLEQVKTKKKAKTRLPMARLEKVEKIYLDPVALVSIAVALVLLVVMLIGAFQLREDWAQHQIASDYLSQLKLENATLTRTYQKSYDLEEIRAKAVGLGLVPEEELQTRTVLVTVPEPEPEPAWHEELISFWKGLWE